MRSITISVVAMVTLVALASVVGAQDPGTVRSAGTDLLAGLVGDMVRFERGMRTLEDILSKNPTDLEAKVLHGNGVMARAGEAFKVGNNEKAIQLWQSGLEEMAQAVDAAPDNLFVRARRGVFMIAASRNTPPQMAKPLLETAVADFSKVLQIREREHTLAERSVHHAVFLDIQMPGMTGFELLQKLPKEPAVVFTTAYDRFALEAFEVNSIDYLLKLIELDRLEKALTKVERLQGTPQAQSESEHLRAIARELTRKFPERIASRLGERIVFVEVGKVTHFYAKDKLTYAATPAKDYVIDATISELEAKLDPALFLRIHRATLLNLNYVEEVSSWFGGGMVVRVKDGKRTELPISRDRLREVKERLEF